MFCEVHIPDHSPDHRGFSYFVPDFLRSSVRLGCVVEVPLKDELVTAVVTALPVPEPERGEAKSVASVVLAEPVLSECQIAAAYELARRHFTHFHATVSFFLPNVVLRRHVKRGRGFPIPSSEGASVGRDRKNGVSTPTLLYDRTGLGAEGVFGAHVPAEPGTVLVFPSEAAAERFLEATAFPKESFLVFREGMPEARDFDFRMRVARRGADWTDSEKSASPNEIPFLIWGRRLCSYNLSAYPNFVYFEDALASEVRHRFFHSYDLRSLFPTFAERGMDVTVCSQFPSVATIHSALSAGTLKNVP